MEALRIKKHIDSEILNLPVPKTMVGKNVEIIVLVESDDTQECQPKKKRQPGSAKGLIRRGYESACHLKAENTGFYVLFF